jgi:pimeloyl-ACP methyl ester carboxylesterase
LKSLLRQRARRDKTFCFVLAVALTAATLSASGAGATGHLAPTPPFVVKAEVHIAHTKLGDVQYRAIGHGPALVLIMGYAGTMQTWDPHFVDSLALHFRVITFNNAGIGNTSALGTPLSIDEMADQTSALITTLRLGDPDVLGWSMGSMIAQSLAIRHPGQVRRLILCATYPGSGNAVQPSQKDVAALTDGDVAAAQADLFPADQAMAAAAFDGGLGAYPPTATTPAKVIANQKTAVLSWFNGSEASGHRANQISIPTLVADGADDRIDASSNDQEVASQIHGSRLMLYPNAGHAFLFQEGEAFSFLVRTFLAGVPTPLNQSQIRRYYLVDYKTVTEAGTKWVASLKSLSASTTAQDLARIDLRYADAQGAFDGELLSFGAKGALGASVHAFVGVNELVVRYVQAFSVQIGPEGKRWTAAIKKDGKVLLVDENVLRHELGLSPIVAPTPTTTTTTTLF